MKKGISVILAVLLAVSCLTGLFGCGSSKKTTLYVYNWGQYISEGDDGSLDVIAAFEEAYPNIRVQYSTYDSNEIMYSKLSNGGITVDVIIPSDYMISRMIEEDMLEKLDFDHIPNFEDIDPTLKNPAYDPTGEYSVPYTWGTVGIIYNTEVVTKPVTGWSILFDPDYAGQILMFDNSRDCLGIALKYLGYSYNTTDEAQITEAVDLLLQQKKDGLVQAYVMDQIFDKLEGGEAAIGPYYAGDFITMHEANPSLAFCLPEEGSNVFVDAMCIPKGAANKENAEAFINFMCSTEAGLANCEATGYSTPLLSVQEALPDEVKNDPVAYPDAEALGRCESFANLPEDTLALYDSEWLRLKTGG